MIYLSSGTTYTMLFLLGECNALNWGSKTEPIKIHIGLCSTDWNVVKRHIVLPWNYETSVSPWNNDVHKPVSSG